MKFINKNHMREIRRARKQWKHLGMCSPVFLTKGNRERHPSQARRYYYALFREKARSWYHMESRGELL